MYHQIRNKNTFWGAEDPEFVGNFKVKVGKIEWSGILIQLNTWDLEHLPCKLKEDEIMLRYYTDTTLISRQKPLVKINIKKGLIYFLKPEAESADFETKGCKLDYLNLMR